MTSQTKRPQKAIPFAFTEHSVARLIKKKSSKKTPNSKNNRIFAPETQKQQPIVTTRSQSKMN